MQSCNLYNYKLKAIIDLSGEEIEAFVIFDYVDRIVYINQILHNEKDIKSIVGGSVEANLERLLYKTFGR